MKTFFTSDLHFGHENVIKYDKRPFLSTHQMDDALIRNWNRKVSNEDLVYILGDISWHSDAITAQILNELNGRKILIKGNHDGKKLGICTRACFEEITDYKELHWQDNTYIVLSHYPIKFFNRRHYGAYMLYGHVHNTNEWLTTERDKLELENMGQKCNMFNVGTMLHSYEPVTLEEIVNKDYSELY